MAHFYGSLDNGRSSEATRPGSIARGLTAHIRGWNDGVRVEAYEENGEDCFRIVATGGSNDPSTHYLIGIVRGDTFVPNANYVGNGVVRFRDPL